MGFMATPIGLILIISHNLVIVCKHKSVWRKPGRESIKRDSRPGFINNETRRRSFAGSSFLRRLLIYLILI